MSNKKLYEHNRELLNNYRWWSATNGELLAYEEVHRNIKDDVKVIRTETNTRPLFLNLDNPLLLSDELNTYHLEYVVDNVRRSEDYGGDNHVYLYYSDVELIYAIMMEYDLSRILEDDKVFFLVGEDNLKNNYTYDFLNNESIDYDSMEPKPFQVEEIKRIIIDSPVCGYSGNVFMAGILDAHFNLLTMQEFGGAGLGAVYYEVFQGRAIREAREIIENMCNGWIAAEYAKMFRKQSVYNSSVINPVPNWDEFWEIFETKCQNQTPDEGTFIRAIYLAYNEAMWGIRNARIAPAIRATTHRNSDYIVVNRYKENARKTFLYRRELHIMRNPVIRMASQFADHALLDRRLQWEVYGGIDVSSNWEPYENRYGGAKWVIKEELSDNTRIIRFEDLKLHTTEALKSLCVFLDIPFDENMWYTTENGRRCSYISKGKGKSVGDYNPKPAMDYKPHIMSEYDIYRFEMLFQKELTEGNYEFKEYDGKSYSDEEIHIMFRQPFRFERFRDREDDNWMCELFHCKLDSLVSHMLLYPVDKTGDGEQLYHVPILDIYSGAKVFDECVGAIVEEDDAFSVADRMDFNPIHLEDINDVTNEDVQHSFDGLQKEIDELENNKKLIERQIENGDYSKIFLYGAGVVGQLIAKELEYVLKEREVFFVDRNNKLWGKEIACGITCKSLEYVYGCGNNAIIVITPNMICDVIKKELMSDSMQTRDRLQGIEINDEYCRIIADWNSKRLIASQKKTMCDVIEHVRDKRTHLFLKEEMNVLRWGTYSWIKGVINNDLVYEDAYASVDIFSGGYIDGTKAVVCGVHTDVIIRCLDLVKKVCSIEVYELNKAYMNDMIKNPPIDGTIMSYHNAVLGDHSRKLSLQEVEGELINYRYLNYVIDDSIRMISLDTEYEVDEGDSDNDSPVNMIIIAMDGGIISAIKGMRNIIKNYQPYLVIQCALHFSLPEEWWWNVMESIKGICNDYQFIVRRIKLPVGEDIVLCATPM